MSEFSQIDREFVHVCNVSMFNCKQKDVVDELNLLIKQRYPSDYYSGKLRLISYNHFNEFLKGKKRFSFPYYVLIMQVLNFTVCDFHEDLWKDEISLMY